MNHLSLRLRLTLVFVAVMAVVMTAVGAFLYVRLGDELDAQVERRLDGSMAALQAVIEVGAGAVPQDALDEQEVAQVISADGSVVATAPAVASQSVLDPPDLERARAGRVLLERRVLDDDPVLLLAEALQGSAGAVIVVGASLESRDDAVYGLLTQLAVVVPAALLLASLAGYALAGAALRPVEAMRARADTISAQEPGARLPLPPADDEIRRLGETLNAMLERLEDALERERRFVADASHELRTPLAALRTELDLALRRPRSREELELALRSVAAETDRLARLADDLLALARSDAGTLEPELEPLAGDELLRAVAERFTAPAAREHVTVTVTSPDVPVLLGDRLLLEQALGNVLDNALRHGAGPVELTAATRDGDVVLAVRDRGRGFPPSFLPRAFEPFACADDARTGDSTGLGLAIAVAIVEAHGGSASARNLGDGGAVVELRVPAAVKVRTPTHAPGDGA